MKAAKLEAALVERLCRERDFAGLEALVAQSGASEWLTLWPRLRPFDKLVVFKLMDAPRAFEFYSLVAFEDKYFLLSGFSLNAIAPILEDLPVMERRRFLPLPRDYYDRMLRKLLAA